MTRLIRTRLLARGALATVLTLWTVFALGQTPSASQIEAFRNLPPDQQQAIIDASGGGSRSGVTTTDAPIKMPSTMAPRAVADERESDRMAPDGEPRLAAGDTLILELEPMEFEGQERVLTERTVQTAQKPENLQTTAAAPADRGPAGAAPARQVQTPPNPLATGKEIERAKSEQERLERLIETVRRGNPYRLNRSGNLDVPGLGNVALAGLTPIQATQRLAIEPFLRDFRIRLTLLPLQVSDTDALKPFGYDLFAGVPSTYAPVTDIPVPSEYVVGPGDRLDVQLIGSTKGKYSLVVNRDGRIMFPELGAIAVSGLRIDEAKSRIEQRVQEQMIGTEAIVSLGDLRSIRVFVLGEAEKPGSYTVSGLATVTNALFASGGVKTIGSLRNIQLKRGGNVVARLDLYDLLLRGDTSGDARLRPGDVIFIPPVSTTVGIKGEVRRPALYELKGESSVADLLYLSGGLTAEADPRLATLERIDERRERVVLDVDLGSPQASATRLRSGDVLRIPTVKPTYSNSIALDGHVLRPGSFQYRSGMRLTDVIPNSDELKPNADMSYVMIRREQPGTRLVQVISADLLAAWRTPSSTANPTLAPRDRIYVFDLETGRRAILDPILEELKLQAVRGEPSQVVRVSGRVRVPGEYPLEPGMTVSDLVRAGGGLAEEAYGGAADLARYEVHDGQTRKSEVLTVDLQRAMANEAAADLALKPFDFLVVKAISEWSAQETVRLEGEVRFPGEYPIARGETLRSLIDRAGGLTPLAFPQGSVFTRESLKEREKRQIEALANRLKQDLGTLALQAAQASAEGAQQASETVAIGQTLLADLNSAQPVGRLVIDLDHMLAKEPGAQGDVILKDGDILRVPQTAQEVTVIGEVQSPTSHLYDSKLSREDYIRLSGGTTKKADDKRIYVVRANGSVTGDGGSRWFGGDKGVITPGDTVVVPLDAERMRPLPLWTAVTTIIYNIAVAVAAVNSF
ncbi:MAG: SLBB domain-containing protein [Steroidobacteraceae bacterium]